jgi:hypothetical protein
METQALFTETCRILMQELQLIPKKQLYSTFIFPKALAKAIPVGEELFFIQLQLITKSGSKNTK